MKIVISFGNGWSSNYLVLDAQHAPLAAGLLANGTLYTSDGQTGDGAHYKLDKQSSLSITYANDAQFEELPAAVYEARKQAEEASSARWNEKRRADELQKQLETVQAQLATLQQAVSCTATADAEPGQPAESGDEEG